MKNKILRSLLILLTSFSFLACQENEGGTHTGPGLTSETPSQPDTGGDGNSTDTVALFSKSSTGKDPNWIDTGEDNSLMEVDFMNYQQDDTYGTAVDFGDGGVNVHSHYVGATENSHQWSNYSLSGAMKIDDARGSLGVTFYSDYPNSDSYYRIRRYTREDKVTYRDSFHFSPHPWGKEGTENHCSSRTGGSGQPYTEITPGADVWYRIKITVTTQELYTHFTAKIWVDGNPEPENFQIDCYDYMENRLKLGTVGVWMGSNDINSTNALQDYGKKFYKDFVLEFN